jgi:hypothetical protein
MKIWPVTAGSPDRVVAARREGLAGALKDRLASPTYWGTLNHADGGAPLDNPRIVVKVGEDPTRIS